MRMGMGKRMNLSGERGSLGNCARGVNEFAPPPETSRRDEAAGAQTSQLEFGLGCSSA